MRPIGHYLLAHIGVALVASHVVAQAIVPIGDVEMPLRQRAVDAVAAALVAEGTSPSDADRQAVSVVGHPNLVLMLDDFCEGCQTANFWLVNPTASAVWDVELNLRVRRVNDERALSMTVPVVPARSAARLGFAIPWPMQMRLPVNQPPSALDITVFSDLVIEGHSLSPLVLRGLLDHPAKVTSWPEVLGDEGTMSALSFVFTYLEGPELEQLAALVVELEGSGGARELALDHVQFASSAALLCALPSLEYEAFFSAAMPYPRELTGVVSAAPPECLARLLDAALALPPLERLSLASAAVSVADEVQLQGLTRDIPDEARAIALRRGWELIGESPELPRQLQLLRSLEQTDADRAVAGRTIASLRTDRRVLPAGASSDVERLYAAAADAVREVYLDSLASQGAFEVSHLVGAGIDPIDFFHGSARWLQVCPVSPFALDTLRRCADAIEASPPFLAIARSGGLTPGFLDASAGLLATSREPSEVPAVASRFAPLGLDTLAVAEGLCTTRANTIDTQGAPYLDAAREVDGRASCVADADTLTMSIVSAVLALLVALAVLGYWQLRTRRALRAAMDAD